MAINLMRNVRQELPLKWNTEMFVRLQELEERSQGNPAALIDHEFAALIILQGCLCGAQLTGVGILETISRRKAFLEASADGTTLRRQHWLSVVQGALNEVAAIL